MMLNSRVETIEGLHGWRALQIEANLVGVSRPSGLALDVGQLAVDHREAVVLTGIEVRELVNTVEHVTDKLLEEDAWSHPHFPPEAPRYCARQCCHVPIVNGAKHALRIGGVLGIEIPDTSADGL